MKNILLLLSLVLLLVACNKDQEESIDTVIRVNHSKQACFAIGETTCYQVQIGDEIGSTDWQLFYDEIEGFQFEEGYIQTFKVRITKAENPPADASGLKYTLMEVLSKERAE